MPPAVVLVDAQPGRSARMVCLECGLEEAFERTGWAQARARDHNVGKHPADTPPTPVVDSE